MPKLKDIAIGLLVAPVIIPIMMIASYQDHKAMNKRLDADKKKKEKTDAPQNGKSDHQTQR
jgi:hypothetical protein